MLYSLLLSITVAFIMVSTIRFWGRPPRKQRVWGATAAGAMVCLVVMVVTASATGQQSPLILSGIAVILMAAWLLKLGHDYTKPSTLKPRFD